MCGIVGGYIDFFDKYDQVVDSISHRGPDSQGYYCEGNLFLGHTRLSIQDLSENGKQPMFSIDKRYVIIFNGEIYNHFDLRNSHLPNVNFSSTSDTETVLYLFIEYGENCLQLLNGIFAFGIYDTQLKQLIIARDHFGVKPLYIYEDEKTFLFGSEIKSFLHFEIDRTISYEAIENYLTFLWSTGGMTPFKRVRKLDPGSFIKLIYTQEKNITEQKYFDNIPDGSYHNFSELQVVNDVENLLIKAVKRQLLSDVPVGFFLSGGLDSTLLVAIAKKLNPELQLPCFTIDVSGWNNTSEGFVDDLFYAKKAADYLGVNLHVVKANPNIVDDFDKMIWHLDEPQADVAPLHVYNISKLAREKGIKVLIGGTAGDDIFSGYRRHKVMQYENYIEKIPLLFRKLIHKIFDSLPVFNPMIRRLKKVTHNIGLTVDERIIGYFEWISSRKVKNIFSYEALKSISRYNAHTNFIQLLRKVKNEPSLLQKMLYLEQNTFLVDHNLNYTDKLSMAVGVETRVPYLDLDLVNYVKKIHPSLKIKNGELKYILKKVAERYLPKEIIYRPKTGFGAPVRDWVKNDLSVYINRRLSLDKIEEQNIFNFHEIRKLIDENKKGKIDAAYTIWAILSVTSWHSQFINKKN